MCDSRMKTLEKIGKKIIPAAPFKPADMMLALLPIIAGDSHLGSKDHHLHSDS